MAVRSLPNGYVSDEFDISMDGYDFKDAIVLPLEDYEAMTPEELASMKQARFNAWYALVTASPTEDSQE